MSIYLFNKRPGCQSHQSQPEGLHATPTPGEVCLPLSGSEGAAGRQEGPSVPGQSPHTCPLPPTLQLPDELFCKESIGTEMEKKEISKKW